MYEDACGGREQWTLVRVSEGVYEDACGGREQWSLVRVSE